MALDTQRDDLCVSAQRITGPWTSSRLPCGGHSECVCVHWLRKIKKDQPVFCLFCFKQTGYIIFQARVFIVCYNSVWLWLCLLILLHLFMPAGFKFVIYAYECYIERIQIVDFHYYSFILSSHSFLHPHFWNWQKSKSSTHLYTTLKGEFRHIFFKPGPYV